MNKLYALFLTIALIMTHQAQAQDKTQNKLALATFAGGCFWCMEKPFDQQKGVIDVISGYTAGNIINPTYKQVSSGKSGHVESIQVTYDPTIVGFEKLLEIYWVNVDPTVENKQFCDEGEQYRSEVFYHDDKQKYLAEKSKENLIKHGIQVKTKIVKATPFYPAEDYHQNYYIKNPIRYNYYRYSCGRDNRLDEIWGEERLYPKG